MDVTLRVGLFRDIFPTLMSLFDAAIDALAKREETSDWNPFAGQLPDPRIFSPAPGHYGMAMDTALDDMGESGRQAAADAWLAAQAGHFRVVNLTITIRPYQTGLPVQTALSIFRIWRKQFSLPPETMPHMKLDLWQQTYLAVLLLPSY